MSTLLLLTNALQASTEVLPSLALLPHQIRILPPEVAALVDAPDADAVLLDARRDLVAVRSAVPADPNHRHRRAAASWSSPRAV